jgi:FHA domain/Double zinc ribbon
MTVQCSLGHENPDGSAFCDECGEPLSGVAPVAVAAAPQPAPAVAAAPAGSEVCPSCGSLNPAGESFCSNCGSMLGATAAATGTPAPVATPVPAAAPVMSAAPAALSGRLIVEADNQEFDLSGKDIVLIGREDAVSNIFPDVDLTPHGGEEGGVSRMHARIFVENSQYMLEDENSTNFTFLNRQKLTAKTPAALHDNDEIKLGRVLLRFKEA